MRRNGHANKHIMERISKQIQLVNEMARCVMGVGTASPPILEPNTIRDLIRSASTAVRLLNRQKLSRRS
jgi:hypothetical protein